MAPGSLGAGPRGGGRRFGPATICALALGLTILLGRSSTPLPAPLLASEHRRAAAPAVTALPAPFAVAATASRLGPWRLVGHDLVPSPLADEAVATRGSTPLYRGDLSIPPGVAAQGWTHIGDSDTEGGVIVDPYQGSASATAKMYLVTTSSGATSEYVHPLRDGESPSNSFAAIAPDGRFLVSGEYGTEQRLLVLPMPGRDPGAPPGSRRLARVGDILLDRPVADLQGCDFVTATELLCSSNDPGTELWPGPRPLLQVDLAHTLDGSVTTAHVTDLGPLPQVSGCTGPFETEGIDYDPSTGVLRVEVVPPDPCGELVTVVYRYRGE